MIGSKAAVLAVIGTGSAGMRHLAAARAIAGAAAFALPRRPERRLELEEQGYATAADAEEAAARGARFCVIATDTSRHVEDAIAALDAGMDVLIEKPMAPDAKGAAAIAHAASRAGRRAWVGCVLRFSDTLGLFREWLPELGHVHRVRVECQSYLPDWRPQRPFRTSYSARADEGGVLRDLIHEIDYAGWTFGWPSAVSASLRNTGRLGISAEEQADLLWQIPTGPSVDVHLDYLSRPSRRRLTAWGENGVLEWDGIGGWVRLTPAKGASRTRSSDQKPDERFQLQLKAFLASDPARLATAEDGLRAIAVCDAARRSSESGRQEGV